jgi:hypothetical protein
MIAVNSDACLPVVVLAGMKAGRDVVLEGDVSAALLEGTRRTMDVFRRWSERRTRGLRPVGVRAERTCRTRRATTAGAFFSGGVDSLYTVLRNLERYPREDSRAITHLLLVHGFDVPLEDEAFFDEVRRDITRTARHLDRELVPVATNARDLVRDLDWARYGHGPAMAAVGLALAGMFHTLFVASGRVYTELLPIASHPAVLPLWSTERLEFVYDGGAATRLMKVQLLARHREALASLRVCWENRGGAYNCGRCEKCVRTMLELHLNGVLPWARRFPSDVDLATVATVHVSGHVRDFWADIHTALRQAGGTTPLMEAVEQALSRGAWADSRPGRADRWLWGALGRFGVTAGRARRLDDILLGGKARVWLRGIQRWRGVGTGDGTADPRDRDP